MENFTEIEQSAAELQTKTIFNMATIRYLEFLKIIFGHLTVIEFQMCCCLPDCIKIG